jgi:hypothetical protein
MSAGAVLGGTGYGVSRLVQGGDRAEAAASAGRAPSTARTVRSFVSRPDLQPPRVDVLTRTDDVAPGYLFLAPSSGPGQRGVLVLDDGGDVVWFHPTEPRTAMNFRAALFKGQPVLTWWEGKSEHGLAVGECVIVDQSYREIARFGAGNGRPVDLHELLITSSDTALVASYEVETVDLCGFGGKRRHPVIGRIVQELRIPSSRVLFEWHSLDHVAPAESHQAVGPRFDYFHLNAIDVDADGNLLVSARNTSAVYKIDRRTGRVIWRLGGKKSDFAMGRGTFFAWQHDARSHEGGRLITIFDNGAAPRVEPQSRAIALSIDTRSMRATLEQARTHSPVLQARKTGSAQLLPNGDTLVGWGSEPYFTEYAASGDVVFDARLPHGGQSYRALRFPWIGRPSRPPTVVSAGGVLHASWNGATDVAAWRLLAGTQPDRLDDAGTVQRQGFETALTPPAGARHAAVVALDGGGRPRGTSPTVEI